MNDTMNVFVTSAEDGTRQLLQVRLNDDVFEQLEAQLGGRLISVHLGDHQEITKGSTFEGENIDDDCTLKVVYEARETEELRAFIVDALGRRLDDVPLGTAEDIADDLVKRYPSFDVEVLVRGDRVFADADEELMALVVRDLESRGVRFRLGAVVESIEEMDNEDGHQESRYRVRYAQHGARASVVACAVVCGIGRVARDIGVDLARAPVCARSLMVRGSSPPIYVIGDANPLRSGRGMLTSAAGDDAACVAERIAARLGAK